MTAVEPAASTGPFSVGSRPFKRARSSEHEASQLTSSVPEEELSTLKKKPNGHDQEESFLKNLIEASPKIEALTSSSRTRLKLAALTSAVVVIPKKARTESSPVCRYSETDPEDLLHFILKCNGYSVAPTSSLSIGNFFEESTPNPDVIAAVEKQDIGELQKLLTSRKSLQCCNESGESVAHLACRQASRATLKFLMEEARVSVRVRDHSGRTPLHEAIESSSQHPQFDLVAMLLRACPELVLMADKQGNTPFFYARKEHWGAWCEFLKQHSQTLHPADLVDRYKK